MATGFALVFSFCRFVVSSSTSSARMRTSFDNGVMYSNLVLQLTPWNFVEWPLKTIFNLLRLNYQHFTTHEN